MEWRPKALIPCVYSISDCSAVQCKSFLLILLLLLLLLLLHAVLGGP
jgi:hypothetical protein